MKHLPRPVAGLFAALTGAVAVGAFLYLTAMAGEPAPAINVDSAPLVRGAKAAASYAPVVKKAAPSVVNIFSTHIIRQRLYRSPFYNDPLFRRFFGNPDGGNQREITRKERSLGSGIIVTSDGYILTANHVVDGADEIMVAMGDNENNKFPARIIGADAPTDVAVLKIEGTNLPAITLGDSDQLEVGDVVLAIGNPFHVGQSVSMGIISALGRQAPDSASGYVIQNFIQTDAAINPGNSGGALVDAEGRLIGINTMIESSSSGSEGVGFAVPINLARNVMEHLITAGKVTRGFLGLQNQDLTADLAEGFNLSNPNGVLVDDVMPGGPAANAGVQSGDVIVAFNGKPVDDTQGLQLAVTACAPGSSADLKLFRNGTQKTITVKLGELPITGASQKVSRPSPPATNETDQLDGVNVVDLSPDARQQLQIPDNIKGALVTRVQQDSNAADAGLKQWDVILEINHQAVGNSQDAVNACVQARTRRILVKVWRRDDIGFAGVRFLSVDNNRRN
ncbi:MAG TPA: Do family serine endopeptidase [Verrucomicrobiae bacterium]|nr:Do family serine endopeptidase [Verrucomicrobiae bacterium]